MPTTVVNVKDGAPYDVYIGRAMPRYRLKRSPFANPFRVGPDGDRETVLRKYERYLMGEPELLAQIPSLRGKVLGCWCKPHDCHGDLLAEIANLGEVLSAVCRAEQTGEEEAP